MDTNPTRLDIARSILTTANSATMRFHGKASTADYVVNIRKPHAAWGIKLIIVRPGCASKKTRAALASAGQICFMMLYNLFANPEAEESGSCGLTPCSW